MLIDRCHRFNITSCSLLDSENIGLLLRNVFDSRVSDCLIRDDRAGKQIKTSIFVIGGKGNMIVDNMLKGFIQHDTKAAYTKGNVLVD